MQLKSMPFVVEAAATVSTVNPYVLAGFAFVYGCYFAAYISIDTNPVQTCSTLMSNLFRAEEECDLFLRRLYVLRYDLFRLLKVNYAEFTCDQYLMFIVSHNLVHSELNHLLESFPAARNNAAELEDLVNTIYKT